MKWVTTTIGMAALASAALGQSSARLIIGTSNPISRMNPTTTVTISAAWDQSMPEEFVFIAVDWDLIGMTGEFVSSTIPNGVMSSPGTGFGTDTMRDAFQSQVHAPTIGVIGNKDNPIELGEYVWTTTDFTPRIVTFATAGTSTFDVVAMSGGPNISLIAGFTPGSSMLSVVPAPASLALLGLGGLLCARRRGA